MTITGPMPTPVSLPLPTALPLSPVLQANPSYGVNPYGGDNMFLAQAFQQNSQLTLSARAEHQQQLMQAAQFAAVNNGLAGGALDSDPRQWTPEEAADQTDRALAKLSTINPEMAAQLAEARTGRQDDGGGFFQDLLHLGGELLHPALSLGGKALELLGRTSHVIPNVAFDLADGGDFNLGNDVGGALAGKVNHNWNSVFQEMGWEGGGIGGFLRATIGLAGDIATDPLTYLMPVPGGAKAAEAAATESVRFAGTKLVETAGERGIELAPALIGKTEAETTANVIDAMRAAFDGPGGREAAIQAIKSGKGADILDSRAALIFGATTEDTLQLMREGYETSARSFDILSNKGLRTLWSKTKAEGLVLHDGTGVTAQDLKSFLADEVKNGNFQSKGSAAWKQAEMAARAAGGMRFHFIVPFTSFRYMGPAMNFGLMSRILPGQGLAAVSRFASGHAGITALMDAIIDGKADWADMRNFLENGWTKFSETANPAVVDALKAGRGRQAASVFWSGSERVGRITAALDSQARLARRGLVGFYAHRSALEANTAANSFIQDVVKRAVSDSDNKTFIKDGEKLIADLGDVSKQTPEKLAASKFLDFFPAQLDTSDPAAVEQWFRSTPDGQRLEQLERGFQGFETADSAELDQLAAKLDDVLQTAATVHQNPALADWLKKYAGIQDMVRQELTNRGVAVGNVKLGFDAAPGIVKNQIEMWQRGAGLSHHAAYGNEGDRTLYIYRSELDGTAGLDGLERLTDAQKVADDTGLGYRLHTKPSGAGDDLPVAFRGDLMHGDEHGNATFVREGETTNIIEERARVERARRAMNNAGDQVSLPKETDPTKFNAKDQVRAARAEDYGAGVGDGRIDTAIEATRDGIDRQTAADLTDSLSQFNSSYAGVFRPGENGDNIVTIWDRNNVIRVGDEFDPVDEVRGFFHRALNGDYAKWLHGSLSTINDAASSREEQVLLAVPQMQAKLARETIGMSLVEASEHVKRTFKADLIDDLVDGPLKQRLLKELQELPDVAWEVDPLAAHARYLNDSAQAIRATVLGQQAEALNRIGAIAPGTMAKAPVSDTFQWAIDGKRLSALAKKDKQLVNAVLSLHKAGARYMSRQQKMFAALAEDFGGYAMAVNGHLASDSMHLMTREVEAWVRNGVRMADARRAVDYAQNQLDEGRAALEAEKAATLDAKNRAVEALNTYYDQALPEAEPGYLYHATDAPIEGVAEGGVKLNRGAWNEGIMGTDERVWAAADPRATPGGKHMLRWQEEPGHWTTSQERADWLWSGNPVPARKVEYLGEDGAWHPVEEVLSGPKTEAAPDVSTLEAKWRDQQKVADDAQRAVEGGPRRVEESGVQRQKGTVVGKPVKPKVRWEDPNTGIRYPSRVKAVEAIAKRQEQQQALADKAYEEFTKARNAADEAAPAVAVPPKDLSTRGGAEKLVNQMLDDGQLYLNKNTNEVLRKNTDEFVKRGGGKRLRSVAELEDAAKDFDRQEKQLGEWKALLDNGGRDYEVTKTPTGWTFEGELPGEAKRWTPGEELPPVPEGHTRVFRAGDPGGNWWTPDEGVAKQYAERGHGSQAGTWYRDIPDRPKTGVGGKIERSAAAKGVALRARSTTKREIAQASKLLERSHAAMTEAENAVNKAVAEFKQMRADLRPALVKVSGTAGGGLAGLKPLRIPGMEGFAMPEYIAEEWHRIYDMQGPNFLRQEWRKWVLGPWKRWATYRWPGFHVRNFFGAWFNNWLGGVGTEHYGFAWKALSEKYQDVRVSDSHFDRFQLGWLFGKDSRGTITYGDIRKHLADIGIGEANTQSVLGTDAVVEATKAGMDNLAKEGPSALDRARSPFRKADNALRNVGGGVEAFHRYAAWAAGMQATMGDTMGARAFAMLRHGDYADLTPAEDYIRDLVPFYKWMRTNVPYQIRMLAEQPAKLTLVSDKLKSYAYDVQGLDRQQAELNMPEWMKQDLNLPIPSWVPVFGSKGQDAIKYAMFNLPYSDLSNGLNDYMSTALPYVREFAESWGFKKDSFTGQDLGKGNMVKLSGVFAPLGPLLEHTPWVKKGPDGYFISDQVDHVLTGLPIYSKFRNFLEADPARVEARMGGVLSAIAGVGVRPEDATQAELDFYYNELEPALQSFRDMGVVFPNAQDFVNASNHVTSPFTNIPPLPDVAINGLVAPGLAQ